MLHETLAARPTDLDVSIAGGKLRNVHLIVQIDPGIWISNHNIACQVMPLDPPPVLVAGAVREPAR
jgi:hypothetical protein